MVKGPLNLYMYRKIPQTNGWVEFVSADGINQGYRNFMIVEEKGRRGLWNQFGYYVTTTADSNTFVKVQQATIKAFADEYLSETPAAKSLAMKFDQQGFYKEAKILVAGLMVVGMTGAMLGNEKNRWMFVAGFPLGLVVALLSKPHTLQWEDMVKIIGTYNRELAGKQ